MCEWLLVHCGTRPYHNSFLYPNFQGFRLLCSPPSLHKTSIPYWSLVTEALLVLAYQQWHCSLPLFIVSWEVAETISQTILVNEVTVCGADSSLAKMPSSQRTSKGVGVLV